MKKIVSRWSTEGKPRCISSLGSQRKTPRRTWIHLLITVVETHEPNTHSDSYCPDLPAVCLCLLSFCSSLLIFKSVIKFDKVCELLLLQFCTFRIGAGMIKWFWLIYSLILMIVTSYGFLCMILFGTCSVNFSHLLPLIIVWYWLCGMTMQFNVTDLFPDKKNKKFFVFHTKSVAGIWQGSTCCICTVCLCLQRLRQLDAAAADLWLFY